MSSNLIPDDDSISSGGASDIPIPRADDGIPDAGGVTPGTITPTPTPAPKPPCIPIDSGGHQPLLDRSTNEFKFKATSFEEQMGVIDEVGLYAVLELALIVTAYILSWIPFLGKLPSFLSAMGAFVIMILRVEAIYSSDEYFLERDSYATSYEYDLAFENMTEMYDEIKTKYTQIVLGLASNAFLVVAAIFQLLFFQFDWHPTFWLVRFATFFFSLFAAFSPAEQLSVKDWYPAQFDSGVLP